VRSVLGGVHTSSQSLRQWLEHAFEPASVQAYGRALEGVPRHRKLTLALTLATMGLSVILFSTTPWAVSAAGHRPAAGLYAGPQDISFLAMRYLQKKVTRRDSEGPLRLITLSVLLWGPAEARPTRSAMSSQLKPKPGRSCQADEVKDPPAPQRRRIEGIITTLQPRRRGASAPREARRSTSTRWRARRERAHTSRQLMARDGKMEGN